MVDTSINKCIYDGYRSRHKEQHTRQSPSLPTPHNARASDPSCEPFTEAVASRAECARDDHLLHLVGALADREDLCVAIEAADGVLLDVAVAAVNLHGLL